MKNVIQFNIIEFLRIKLESISRRRTDIEQFHIYIYCYTAIKKINAENKFGVLRMKIA